MKFPWLLYLAATLVGVLAGLVGAVFHALLDQANAARGALHGLLGAAPVPGWLLLMVLGALVLVSAMWLVRRFAPETAGSGVQEVEAILAGQRKLRWRRVLPVKFFAGILSVGSGLVLGREGPTIHLGAALGELVSEHLAPRPGDNHALLAAGAGAGLATAFNAPLAAIVFVIEELRDHFDYRFATVQSVILACCAAVIVSGWMLGEGPDMPLPGLDMAPMAALPLFPLLGVLIGALGVLFNKLLLGSVSAYRALGNAGAYTAAGLTGLILGALLWFAPDTVGGGEGLVESLLHGQPALPFLLALLAVRLLTTVGSYGVGLPGGIFAPMLALGTICGAAFAALVSILVPALSMAPEVFAVAAMGALFAATVRAPLTGIILVIELTDAQSVTLPIILTCLSATFTAESMGGRPIYSALLGLGDRAPPRAPVRRIGIAAMILVAFIAVERIDVAWQGTGMESIGTLAEGPTSAPVVAANLAPTAPVPGGQTQAQTAPSPPPVPGLEEPRPERQAASGSEPTRSAQAEHPPRVASATTEGGRTGVPVVTESPVPNPPTDLGLGEQVASADEARSERPLGVSGPAEGPSIDEVALKGSQTLGQTLGEMSGHAPSQAQSHATEGGATPAIGPPGQTSGQMLSQTPSPTPSALAPIGRANALGAEARFSIQLISFREKASLARFARDEGLLGKALALESMGEPARWHAVLLGAFADRTAAEAALEDLPAHLRRLSPIVRPLGAGERLVAIEGP